MEAIPDLLRAAEGEIKPEMRRAKAQETADEFEQIFVREMVSAMRESAKVDSEEGGMFGTESGSDTYGDWFDEHFAKKVGEGGQLGIAKSLMRDYDRTESLAQLEAARAKDSPKADAALRTLDRVRSEELRARRLPTSVEGGLDVTG